MCVYIYIIITLLLCKCSLTPIALIVQIYVSVLEVIGQLVATFSGGLPSAGSEINFPAVGVQKMGM